eukprot:GEMP01051686.1.p1 GENE.GEMP01051686.1~~GEMP01051686.1.p1  ORF type:complete len:206 (+),score=25.22 GEMP01051686.1:6-623(+)
MKFFKIVYIGDSAVGKSALIYRFVHNESLTDTKATVGIAFKRTNLVDADNNEDYDIQLWDTAGQEKFQSVSTHHYRGADGALLCYDISNPSTLQSCDRWLQELREHTDENVVVALVANKMDLSPNVDLEEARNYAKSQGLLFFCCSSFWDKRKPVDGHSVGVEGILLEICRNIRQRSGMTSRLDSRTGIQLESIEDSPDAARCPC